MPRVTRSRATESKETNEPVQEEETLSLSVPVDEVPVVEDSAIVDADKKSVEESVSSTENEEIPVSVPVSPPLPAQAAAVAAASGAIKVPTINTSVPVIAETQEVPISPPLPNAGNLQAVAVNINGPSDFSMTEEAPLCEEEEEDKRELSVRIVDKNWRVRSKAYNDMKALVEAAGEAKETIFSEYCSLLPAVASDSSPAALDNGLSMLIVFIHAAPACAHVEHCTDKLSAAIIDKTFSARRELQAKGQQVLLKLMEYDAAEPVVAILLGHLADKKPKVPPACLETITLAMQAFGTQALPSKLSNIIKALPALLDNTNGALREQAMALLVETARWVGSPPLQIAVLDKLRSSQKTDFEQLLAKVSPDPVEPTVWLRKMRPSPGDVANADSTAVSIQNSSVKAPTFTARDLTSELDLGASLKSTEFHNLAKEEKWSKQLQAMQLVLDLLGSAPKVVAGSDVSAVLTACKLFLRQGTHVTVQLATIKVLGMLAESMRAEFGPLVRPVVQSIVTKCGEKKLAKEVQVTLAVILRYCLNFDSLCEDVSEHISNKKVPSVGRVGLVEMTSSAITTTPDRFSDASMKSLTAAVIASAEDADSSVREACTGALTVLLVACQTRGKTCESSVKAIQNLEHSNAKLFKRITSAAVPTVVAPTSTAAASESAAAAELKSPAPATKNVMNSQPNSPVKNSPMAEKVSSSPVKAPQQKAKKISPKKEPAAETGANDDPADDMDLETATSALAALKIEGWEDSMQALMDSSKWNEKVEALTAMTTQMTALKLGGQLSRPLVVYISGKTAGLKISNVNVSKACLTLCAAAAQHTGTEPWYRPAAARLVSAFATQLADKKQRDEARSMLTSLCEATSPVFVLGRMAKVLESNKAPTIQLAFLEWAVTLVAEFGMAALPAQTIVKFCETGIAHKLPFVRTAAITLLGAVYHELGPRVQSMLGKLEAAQQTTVEAEFARVGYDASANKKPARMAQGAEGAVEGTKVIPRQDLLVLLAKTVPADLMKTEGKTSWQTRKAALEAVITACTSSGYYLEFGKSTQDLLRSLKARLNDTQMNLKPIAAQAIGALIVSLESKVAARALAAMGSALLSCFSDNKKAMRDAVIASLNTCITLSADGGAGGTLAEPTMLLSLLPAIVETLANPVGRLELLGWLQQHFTVLKGDVADLAAPLVVAMQDKTAPVRVAAEATLLQLAQQGCLSMTSFDKATRDLSDATKRSFQGSLDRIRGVLAPSAAAVEESSGPRLAAPERVAKAAEPPAPSLGAPMRAKSVLVSRPSVAAAAAPKATSVAPVIVVASASSNTNEADDSMSADSADVMRKTSKAARLDDRKLYWPPCNEDVGEAELLVLQAQWEPLLQASKLRDSLFPAARDGAGVLYNQDSLLPALEELSSHIQSTYFVQHLDLVLRWLAYALCVRETAAGLLKVLRVAQDVLQNVAKQGLTLQDTEAALLLPHLLERSGHKSERHRAAFKSVLEAARGITTVKAQQQYLLPGLLCKNKRSRVVSLEELASMVETLGYTALGRAGLKEIGAFLDARDNDVGGRNACLELCVQLSEALNGDIPKLFKLLGEPSDRTRSLLEARFKQNKKDHKEQQLPSSNNSTPVKEIAPSKKRSPLLGKPARKLSTTHAAKPVAEVPSSAPKGDSISPFRLEMTPPEEGKMRKRFESNIDTSAMDAKLNELSAVMTSLSMSMTPGKPMSPRAKAAGKTFSVAALPVPMEISGTPTSPIDTSPHVTSRSRTTPKSNRSSLSKKKGRNSKGGNSPEERASFGMPSSRKSTSSPASSLDDIYSEIASKMDALLTGSQDDERTHNDATDYIKILHSIASGAWTEEVQASDEQELRMNAQALIIRLVKCVDRAFSSSGYVPPAHSAGASLNIDVSLGSAALATIFALLKRPGVVTSLTIDICSDVLKSCLVHLVNPRLAAGAAGVASADAETAEQIVRALNIIALKLSAEMPPVPAMVALLRVVGASAIGDAPVQTLKPVSKLLLRVIGEENRTLAPFQSSPNDTAALLQALHILLSKLDSRAAHEGAFGCGKTVLTELVKSLGAKKVLLVLQAQGATGAAAVVKLAAKLGNISLDASVALEGRITALVNEIARAHDKQLPMQALFQVQQEHPETDVQRYAVHLSAAHRRFIADRLVALQTASAASVSARTSFEAPDENAQNNFSNTGGSRSSTGSGGGPSGGEGRDSTGKKKKKRSSGGSAGKRLSGSGEKPSALQPRRASLDNVPSPPALKFSEKQIYKTMPPAAPEEETSSAGSSNAADSDLMARFARLKGMANKMA